MTMSESESIWIPVMLVALKALAARPSSASKIIAAKIIQALTTKTSSVVSALGA